MYNLLVTGANGQLGSEIQAIKNLYPDYNFYFTNREVLDITNVNQIENYCKENNINSIINCAAYTNVEKAEDQIELCNAVNHLAVKNLSTVAKELNIQLIHISTDYVFNGAKEIAYLENDLTSPLNVYGNTKLLGEQAMLSIDPKKSIIIRTSWVYSSFGNNFVKSMLHLAKTRDQLNIVSDQVGTPTYAADLAKTILNILPAIQNETVEIYHYSNEGTCSWYNFAFEIFKKTKTNCNVSPIPTSEYPTKAQRPLFTILDKSKIKNTFGIEIPDWKTSLQNCLNKL